MADFTAKPVIAAAEDGGGPLWHEIYVCRGP